MMLAYMKVVKYIRPSNLFLSLLLLISKASASPTMINKNNMLAIYVANGKVTLIDSFQFPNLQLLVYIWLTLKSSMTSHISHISIPKNPARIHFPKLTYQALLSVFLPTTGSSGENFMLILFTQCLSSVGVS